MLRPPQTETACSGNRASASAASCLVAAVEGEVVAKWALVAQYSQAIAPAGGGGRGLGAVFLPGWSKDSGVV